MYNWRFLCSSVSCLCILFTLLSYCVLVFWICVLRFPKIIVMVIPIMYSIVLWRLKEQDAADS